MSTDYNILCVDCCSTHDFCDANHRDRDMRALIRHAPAIAALVRALEDPDLRDLDLRLGSYGAVAARWFADHAGHRLVPVDEYGFVPCGEAGIAPGTVRALCAECRFMCHREAARCHCGSKDGVCLRAPGGPRATMDPP